MTKQFGLSARRSTFWIMLSKVKMAAATGSIASSIRIPLCHTAKPPVTLREPNATRELSLIFAWEEIIAGAFKKEGYDEVILTPRSGDDGRDVIAIRKGIGTVKILGSVKAYGPGRLVRHNDVRDFVGVLALEPDSSKGIITTTSDFAPKVYTNPKYKVLMPTRLELVNGKQLQEWLSKLSKERH